jgi:cytochrome-b5 reductase
MKYHPGGIDELMRGAGKNSTNLFNDVHPWVNYENMLKKCEIGRLAVDPVSLSTSNDDLKAKIKTSIDSKPIVSNKNKEFKPTIDFYDTNTALNLILYTKCDTINLDHLIVEKRVVEETSQLFLIVYSPTGTAFKFNFELPDNINDNYTIKLSGDGKFEIKIHKIKQQLWTNFKIISKIDQIEDIKSGVYYRDSILSNKVKLTHDTFLYYFSLPSYCHMPVPIGFHVFLKIDDKNESFYRPYTPVDDKFTQQDHSSSLVNKKTIDTNVNTICLLIKHYEDGFFTPKLDDLKIGSHLQVSSHCGSFKLDWLENNCNNVILLCAGTGITPMIRIINYVLYHLKTMP